MTTINITFIHNNEAERDACMKALNIQANTAKAIEGHLFNIEVVDATRIPLAAPKPQTAGVAHASPREATLLKQAADMKAKLLELTAALEGKQDAAQPGSLTDLIKSSAKQQPDIIIASNQALSTFVQLGTAASIDVLYCDFGNKTLADSNKSKKLDLNEDSLGQFLLTSEAYRAFMAGGKEDKVLANLSKAIDMADMARAEFNG